MGKLVKRYFSLLCVIVFCIITLSGCYNIQNIDRLAYVVALGFDVGENNNLKMSFQISTPSGGSESGSSSQSSSTIVNSIECSTIDSGINLINSYISKELNLSHCKVLVFSEQLAIAGLSEYIYTLVNKIQIRPDCNIIVSKCDAAYFLENSKPTLEQLSARYYEVAPSSSEYTGYTENIELGNFFSALKDTFINPCAILGGVNTEETHNVKSGMDNISKDSSYVAGQTPIDTKPNIENMGLAVFKGDTLVGELNGLETICHLLVTGKLKTANITIPSPFSNTDSLDLNIRLKGKPHNKVTLVNGSPYISTRIRISARILSVNKDSEYLNSNNIQIIEEYANSYLASNVSAYLYKTAKIYESDITGFGQYCANKFLFWKDWTKYNWLNNYKNSAFDVNIDTNVKSSYILLNT